VHGWSFYCEACDESFATSTWKDIGAVRDEHKKKCTPRPRTEEEEATRHTHMTKEQEESVRNWRKTPNDQVRAITWGGLPVRNYVKIFIALYPDREIPDLRTSSPIRAFGLNLGLLTFLYNCARIPSGAPNPVAQQLHRLDDATAKPSTFLYIPWKAQGWRRFGK
jgi:hypothetical protein